MIKNTDINKSAINELNRSTETYTLPSHWAGYLINSDATGYSDEEIQEIDDFCDAHELGFCTGVSDDTWFQHGHDANRNQGADVADFTFSVDTPEAETYARVEESSYVPKKANKNKFNGKFRSKIKTFESFINELDDARYELDADDIKHMNTELTAEDFQLDDETYIKIMNEFGISEDQRKGETPKDAFEFFFSNILHAAKESGKLGELAKYSIHY